MDRAGTDNAKNLVRGTGNNIDRVLSALGNNLDSLLGGRNLSLKKGGGTRGS